MNTPWRLDSKARARTGNVALRERLRALSARYDDEYFGLDEEDDAGTKPEER
jgi:hypothetical protein